MSLKLAGQSPPPFGGGGKSGLHRVGSVSYTHLTLPLKLAGQSPSPQAREESPGCIEWDGG